MHAKGDPSPADVVSAAMARRLPASGRALEGERKHLTVLFADVVDSVRLAGRLGPEAWHEVMHELFQILTTGVHRFDGTVNQYTGDGIMALFGAPIAHEDHAQRACHAARHLAERLASFQDGLRAARGVTLTMRMGLNSGEVVIGSIGDDLRIEYSAQGHMVGLAARMEQLARPGHACLSEHTARLVAGYFTLRDLGSFDVKGMPAPVRAYELGAPCAASSRLQVARTRGFSRLVGRDAELGTLEALLTSAQAGRARIVRVVGDPGVGKSRLCHEFVARCRRRHVPVYEARCVSHGQAVPFQPILELLRSVLKLDDRTPPSQARALAREAMVACDPALEVCLPVLFEFLGIADPERPALQIDPDARQRQLGAALRGVVRARSATRPAVILIDDVHWIDPGSAVLLRELCAAVPGTCAFVLLNARLGHALPALEPDRGVELALSPLGARAAGALIDELLGEHRSIAGLRARIRERTAGNPFFIEEVVRSLVESGALHGRRGAYRLVHPAADVSVPATVHAVLAARIDRLGDGPREVLRAAAVVGRTFSRAVLTRVVSLDDAKLDVYLRALESATLIHREPGASEAEFRFHHPLTQEVGYRTQIVSQRTQLHAGVARALEAIDRDRLDEQAPLIAYHWEGANEPWHAASWHARAASWRAVVTQAESLRHWRKVRELLRLVPPSRDAAALGLTACVRIMNLGWRLGFDPAEAHQVFSDGRDLGARTGDTLSLAMLANLYLVNLYSISSRAVNIARERGARPAASISTGRARPRQGRRAEALAREARRLVRATDDPGLRLAGSVSRVYSLYFSGHLEEALAHIDLVLAETPADHRLGRDMFLYSPRLWITSFRGQLLNYLGRPAAAAAALGEAVRAAIELDELENRGWAEGFWVMHCWFVGDAAAALRHANTAMEIAETTGSAFSRVLAFKVLGIAHGLAGAWPAAVAAAQSSLEVARDTRANLLEEGSLLGLLATAHYHAGHRATARAMADEAVAVARRRRTPVYECQAHLARAAVLLPADGPGAARSIGHALARAQQLAEQTAAQGYAPFIHEGRAALARLRGNEPVWRRELGEARRQFDARDAAGHLRRLDGATVAAASGDHA